MMGAGCPDVLSDGEQTSLVHLRSEADTSEGDAPGATDFDLQ